MAQPDLPHRTALEPSTSLRTVLVVALAIAVLAGGGAWLWFRGGDPAPASAPAAGEAAPGPAAAPPEAAADAAETPAAPVAPADVRALLEEASANAAYRAWLREESLVTRWALVTENVATGASPREHLSFLEPPGAFSVVERGGRTVIAPESYRRYDVIGDAVATLDAGAIARAYRALHPALDAAYRALGYPRGALDRATAKALGRIVAAPAVDGDVAVVDEGGIYLFDDPALERLGEVDKHLLRMGPRNTRLLQAKAREFLAALALPAAVTPTVAR